MGLNSHPHHQSFMQPGAAISNSGNMLKERLSTITQCHSLQLGIRPLSIAACKGQIIHLEFQWQDSSIIYRLALKEWLIWAALVTTSLVQRHWKIFNSLCLCTLWHASDTFVTVPLQHCIKCMSRAVSTVVGIWTPDAKAMESSYTGSLF